MILSEVETYLQFSNCQSWSTKQHESTINDLNESIEVESSCGADKVKKHVWCIKQIAIIQFQYINAFNKLKDRDFYGAWCALEQCENGIQWLVPHYNVSKDLYGVRFIRDVTKQYQSLYPYKLFTSPEFLIKAQRCNICEKRVTPRSTCGHKVGEIYNGKMCGRRIEDVELLGLALVSSPKQKYSVFRTTVDGNDVPKDRYSYKELEYIISRLQSPFQWWEYQETERRHSHDNFGQIGRNDPCPCGSGIKYKKCCLQEDGVLLKHFAFKVRGDVKPEYTII